MEFTYLEKNSEKKKKLSESSLYLYVFSGLQMIKHLCLPDYSTVEMEIATK